MKNLPLGWYVAARSNQVNSKKSRRIQLFDKEFIIYRDKKGQAVLMEEFCVHMGASLANAKVVDGCVECPFHKWQFNSSGKCVVAPGVDVIPKTAVEQVYPTLEKYGYVWVWYGSDQPTYDLPEFEMIKGSKMRRFLTAHFGWEVKTTARRLLENVYDSQHLITIHGVPTDKFELTTHDFRVLESAGAAAATNLPDKQATARAFMENNFTFQMDLPEAKLAGLAETSGARRFIGPLGVVAKLLGLKTDQMALMLESWPTGHMSTARIQGQVRQYLMIALTPISEKRTIQHIFVLIEKENVWYKTLAFFSLFAMQSVATLLQDLPIWNNMKIDGGGAYVKYDHGVLRYRAYYDKWASRATDQIATQPKATNAGEVTLTNQPELVYESADFAQAPENRIGL